MIIEHFVHAWFCVKVYFNCGKVVEIWSSQEKLGILQLETHVVKRGTLFCPGIFGFYPILERGEDLLRRSFM